MNMRVFEPRVRNVSEPLKSPEMPLLLLSSSSSVYTLPVGRPPELFTPENTPYDAPISG